MNYSNYRMCEVNLFIVVSEQHEQAAGSQDRKYSPEIMAALEDVQFIAQHLKDEDKDIEVSIFNYRQSKLG